MDADRFDRISRAVASRPNRRDAMRTLGAGGVAAALLAATGLRRPAAGQEEAATCQLDLVASVRLGPSTQTDFGGDEPGQLRATLRFRLSSSGRLIDATMTLPDDSDLNVTGQSTGQSASLRVTIPLGGTLVLVGAGEHSFKTCDGAVDGLLTGPQPGDLGDWHAIATKLDDESQPDRATAAPSSDTGGAGEGSQGSEPSQAPEVPPETCAPANAPCNENEDCCSRICVDGTCLDCSPAQGPCAGAGVQGSCCAGLVCGGSACYVPYGGACAEDFDCPATCVGGVCVDPDAPTCAAPGEACSDAFPCCDNHYCQPALEGSELPDFCF